MRPLRKALVFIDWHNVEELLAENVAQAYRATIPRIILRIQNEISSALTRIDSTALYRASLRIYHGWHREDMPTSIRQQFEVVMQNNNFERTIGIVSFSPDIKFGDELACESDFGRLFDTSRPQGQKMVDTAIACDMLYTLKSGIAHVGVIVSDDDDFIPAAMTANAWGLDAVLLRGPGHDVSSVVRGHHAVKFVSHWRAV